MSGRKEPRVRAFAVVAALFLWGFAVSRAEGPAAPAPDPLSWTKDIRLSIAKIDISGEERIRVEARRDFDLDGRVDRDDTLYLHRARLGIDIRFGAVTRVFFEGTDGREIDSDARPMAQQNETEPHQLFLELRKPFGAPVAFTAGRFEANIGSKRLIASPKWLNNIRSYDGFRLRYDAETWNAEAFGFSAVAAREDEVDIPKFEEELAGLYLSCAAVPKYRFDGYFIALVDDDNEVPSETSAAKRGGVDRDYIGLRALGPVWRWITFETEGIRQFGEVGTDRVGAWMYSATVSLAPPVPLGPMLNLIFNLGTGDRDPTDGKRGTFIPPYAAVHEPLGIIDFTRHQNLREWALTLSVAPTDALFIQGEYHDFTLEEPKDAWVNAGGTVLRRDATGGSGDDLGREFDLVARYRFDAHLALEGGYARFVPGGFVDGTGPDDPAELYYLEGRWGF
jgi:hypothetical protein